MSVFNVSGTKPAPKPCNLCGPGSPPLNTGEASGSIATISMLGYFSFNTLPTPDNVPPVPTPAKKASISLPSNCSTSSGPVVHACTSGLAGFSNCCGSK